MFTKAELFQYLDSAIKRGDVNTHTGNAWKAASKTVLAELGDEDDVENYDTHAALLRYNNLNPHELSGDSMRKYEQRTKSAIEQFIKWKTDPMGYKPPSRVQSAKTNGSTFKGRRTEASGVVAKGKTADIDIAAPLGMNASTGSFAVNGRPANLHVYPARPAEPGLVIPFPLRPGFVAQFTIPQDLTVDEAKRLSVFIQALGHDAPKVDQP